VTTTPPEASTDGRVARGERTRAAIITAFLDLLVEGRARPRAKEIAARAGVSVRSIFQHFEDLESLRTDVVHIQGQRIRPLLEDLDTTGDLRNRARSLAQQRATLYEFIGPVRRSMRGEPSTAESRGLAELALALSEQVAAQFAPELAALPRDRRDPVAIGADVLCSFPAWDHLRAGLGLTVEQATLALATSLEQLVAT